MANFKQGKVTTHASTKVGKDGEEKSKIKELKTVTTDGTVVTAGYDAKISANYNSVGVNVGVSLPTTKDNVKAAFKEAWELCTDEMSEQLEEAKALLKQLR